MEPVVKAPLIVALLAVNFPCPSTVTFLSESKNPSPLLA